MAGTVARSVLPLARLTTTPPDGALLEIATLQTIELLLAGNTCGFPVTELTFQPNALVAAVNWLCAVAISAEMVAVPNPCAVTTKVALLFRARTVTDDGTVATRGSLLRRLTTVEDMDVPDRFTVQVTVE